MELRGGSIGGALLAAVLLVHAFAVPVGASVRQASLDDAETDTSIFVAILTGTLEGAEDELRTTRTEGLDSDATAREREELRTSLARFDKRLVEVIQAEGTPPPRMAEFVDLYNELSDNSRQLLEDQEELAGSLDRLPPGALDGTEPVLEPESVDRLQDARAKIAREQGTLRKLATLIQDVDKFGVPTAPLVEAIEERRAQLETVDDELFEHLARLQLPRLLTIEPARTSVRLGSSLLVTGLALSGGQPATGTRITLSLGPHTSTIPAPEDGRIRATVAVPTSLQPGTVQLQAQAQINGSAVETDTYDVTILPYQPSIEFETAVAILDDREPLGFQGSLDLGPFEPDGREVTIRYGETPVSNVTTDGDGRFQGAFDTADLDAGRNMVQAVFEPADPRLASVSSHPVRVFVPGTADEVEAEATETPEDQEEEDDEFPALFQGAGGTRWVLEEFDFPSTGLGPIVDLLVGLMVLGMLVLFGHALLARREGVGVRGWKAWAAFSAPVQFDPVPEDKVLEAHPMNAFPPDEIAGSEDLDVEPGVVFAAFVEALRELDEDLPNGVTHRELVRDLGARTRLDPGPLQQAAILFERVQYAETSTDGRAQPGSRGDQVGRPKDPTTLRRILDAFQLAWDAYVEEHVDDPEDSSSWLPKAPTWVPGTS